MTLNAGAVNAGGLLVLHMYTSHMTGFASQAADGLVLGNTYLGFVCVVPLPAVSIPPLMEDVPRSRPLQKLLAAFRRRPRCP
ncbi:hypothetical protein VAPA_1c12660 [Variovorax paradoxus B4]|uniref:Uncharacterized protein n=1 Tax=Variovorax paradoxus B4 TaxID=1246301 RepID=T1X7C5_VARPD|nr:hypothetical protein VAPA_1c12660 [Variovorax paradoxus B4]